MTNWPGGPLIASLAAGRGQADTAKARRQGNKVNPSKPYCTDERKRQPFMPGRRRRGGLAAVGISWATSCRQRVGSSTGVCCRYADEAVRVQGNAVDGAGGVQQAGARRPRRAESHSELQRTADGRAGGAGDQTRPAPSRTVDEPKMAAPVPDGPPGVWCRSHWDLAPLAEATSKQPPTHGGVEQERPSVFEVLAGEPVLFTRSCC